MVTVEQLTKELTRLSQDRLDAVWAFLQALKWVKSAASNQPTAPDQPDILRLQGIIAIGGDALEDAERLYDE